MPAKKLERHSSEKAIAIGVFGFVPGRTVVSTYVFLQLLEKEPAWQGLSSKLVADKNVKNH